MPLNLVEFQAAAQNIDLAGELILELSELAQWIIKDDILRSIALRFNRAELGYPPIIDENKHLKPGVGLIVVVNTHGEGTILRSGYLLPVHWRVGTGEHDSRLPQGLKNTANQVLQELGLSDFRLQLMLPGQHGPQHPLLPDAHDDMSSAFAMLACSLKLLVSNNIPDLKAICTGKLNNRKIEQVSHLRQKTEAVLEFPPRSHNKRFTHWFVPAGRNAEEAAATMDQNNHSQLTLRAFSDSQTLDEQLNPLLARMGSKPDPEKSDFGSLQEHYQWLLEKDPNQAQDYYNDILYQQILKRGFLDGPPAEAKPTHFVSVVSTPALIGLAHQLFRFQHVLIMHTSPDYQDGRINPIDFSEKAKQAKLLIDQSFRRNVLVKPIKYRPHLTGVELWQAIANEMKPHLLDFLGDLECGKVMWDMTSGLRVFSHVLEKSFARPGDWMLTINQQWSAKNGSRIPCTETLVAWKHGSIEREEIGVNQA